MALKITAECIACGNCEPACPNEAISRGEVYYRIDPLRCTECVGFFNREQCLDVCPVEAPVPDPENSEEEATLIARARALHPDRDFGEDFPSRFRG